MESQVRTDRVKTLSSPYEIDIEHIIAHAICEAKAHLLFVEKATSARYRAQQSVRAAARELVLEGMARGVFPDKSNVERVTQRAFKSIEYEGVEKDKNKIVNVLTNVGSVLQLYELAIIGGALPVSVSYGGTIVKGVVDGIVLDKKRGYKYPLIIDLSLTRYDPEYNPILYRCDVVSTHFNPVHDTTRVCVVDHRTRWFYSHTYYHAQLYASIEERAEAIINGSAAFRFGWWCAGCEFRGSCHVIMN